MSQAASRPYPKLTPEQKARVLAELRKEFLLGNVRPQGGEVSAWTIIYYINS
jgi:hypothetical protein